ncbi:hypothetical protein DFAR_620005 [Desulfarculales bacterium]
MGLPPLLLVDEPTGNLDSLAATEGTRLLVAAHATGSTVLMATHDLKLLTLVGSARLV